MVSMLGWAAVELATSKNTGPLATVTEAALTPPLFAAALAAFIPNTVPPTLLVVSAPMGMVLPTRAPEVKTTCPPAPVALSVSGALPSTGLLNVRLPTLVSTGAPTSETLSL